MLRRATYALATLILVVAAMIAVAGMLPVGPLLYRAMVLAEAPRRADAIVVLGGGVVDEDTPGAATTVRLVHGLRLHHRGYAPLIILTGGNPLDARMPEAAVMRRVAEELGTNPDVLVVETVAARTFTQADAVARLARTRGIRTVLLVTSPEHSLRAVRVFRRAGLDVVSTPVVAKRPPRLTLETRPHHVVERVLALVPWVYEGGALAMYWWRGWL